jgi:hypothetical protein
MEPCAAGCLRAFGRRGLRRRVEARDVVDRDRVGFHRDRTDERRRRRLDFRVAGRHRLLLTMPRPSASHPVVTSDWVLVDGHRVALYAQTLDEGAYVSADVFADGYSLATSEPDTVISSRSAEAATAIALLAPRARRKVRNRVEFVHLVALAVCLLAACFGLWPVSLLALLPILVARLALLLDWF